MSALGSRAYSMPGTQFVTPCVDKLTTTKDVHWTRAAVPHIEGVADVCDDLNSCSLCELSHSGVANLCIGLCIHLKAQAFDVPGLHICLQPSLSCTLRIMSLPVVYAEVVEQGLALLAAPLLKQQQSRARPMTASERQGPECAARCPLQVCKFHDIDTRPGARSFSGKQNSSLSCKGSVDP